MGLSDLVKSYKPVENSEFGAKKKLIGDAVCTLLLEEIVSKKGQKWVIWRATAIHPIEDAKGRETTLEPGDEIVQMYDPAKNESMEELMNDLFTAGIEYDRSGDDAAIMSSMMQNAKDKLVYMRTWCRDLTDADRAKYPDKKESYWQSIKVLSKSKIDDDNSVPLSPF